MLPWLKFKRICHHSHAGDQRIAQSEPKKETEFVQQPRRINFITGKQRLHVKMGVEMVQMDDHALIHVEISKDYKVLLHLKKDEQTMVKHPTLLDAGGTNSVVTPRIFEKMIKELGRQPINVSAFMLENGGEKNSEFNGKHSLSPSLVPNTSAFNGVKHHITHSKSF